MDITKVKLEKGITKAEMRGKYLKEKLDTNGARAIYHDGIDKNFNKLSENIYLSRRVETYATWMLKGDMEKEEEYSYDYLTDSQRNQVEAKTKFIPKGEGDSNESIENQVDKIKSNGIQYKSNNIEITNVLLKDESELGEVLRAYQPLRELLGQQLQLIKNREATNLITIKKDGQLITVPLSFKMVREHLTEVNSDMLLSIIKLKGLDGLRPTPTKIYENKLDAIDYSNWMHIKKVLGNLWLGETPMNEDDIILVADINKALEAIELSELDGCIIKMYNEGWKLGEIGEEVGLNHSNVSRRLDKVSKSISEQLKK